ncbi:hypothetical protein BJV77DRAFT_1023858 [Russula vinacea]|nr:hypothetical protein BJV77DRAFT_1023858 [Russula vinacea]
MIKIRVEHRHQQPRYFHYAIPQFPPPPLVTFSARRLACGWIRNMLVGPSAA